MSGIILYMLLNQRSFQRLDHTRLNREDEQRERMAAMDAIVRGHDVAAWADEFLTAMTPRHELRRSA